MAAHSESRLSTPRDTSPTARFWIGLGLLFAALVVFLALASYSTEDCAAFPELFERGSERTAFNWLGRPGAAIAYGLGALLFGRWAAFGIPAILGVFGWTLIRRRNWRRPLILATFLLGFTVWLSTALGLTGRIGEVDQRALFHHEGNFGYEAARWLAGFLNYTGALLAMIAVLIAGLALSVAGFAGWFEHKVTATIDRAAEIRLPRRGRKTDRDPADARPPGIADSPPVDRDRSASDAGVLTARTGGKRGKAAEGSQITIKIEDSSGYVFPPLDIFNPSRPGADSGMPLEEQQRLSDLLERTLSTFGVSARVVRVNPGPVITRFDLEPAPGIKVSRIEALADDIALALRARGLRILAPIPGVAAVGVELANVKPETVTFREVVESSAYQASSSKLTIALGRTVSGEIRVSDLAALPHLLIAGTTGSGKSVCVNTIIASILLRASPEDVQFVLIDPKKLELSAYNELRRHHVTHCPGLSEYVVTRPDEAVKVLRSCMEEMERRYDLLAERGARVITEYNDLVRQSPGDGERPLPHIVVIIDELADLMVTAQREVEEPIARLAQMARAVGLHLVVATQRPSVDVITGVIKANFPARIAFRVAMKVDSRTILDANGAETLLGQGDMLFQHPEDPSLQRIQGALLTSQEITRLISHICKQPPPREKLILPELPDEAAEGGFTAGEITERDPLFDEALRIVIRTNQGSVSILQRRLKVGYARAARLIDQLERAGVVGPFDGSKARAVLVDESYLNDQRNR